MRVRRDTGASATGTPSSAPRRRRPLVDRRKLRCEVDCGSVYGKRRGVPHNFAVVGDAAENIKGGHNKETAYFSQDHTFRLEFDHTRDPRNDIDRVDSKRALVEWIRSPEQLLIASYGKDNVSHIGVKKGDLKWCVLLPPVRIFGWKVLPSFDVTAQLEDEGVTFTSQEIILDGNGGIAKLKKSAIEFSLYSRMRLQHSEEDKRDSVCKTTMVAENVLMLGVALPSRLARAPGVKQTGNAIVKAILSAVDKSAKKRLKKSFEVWKSNKAGS